MSKIIIYDTNCKFCRNFASWCLTQNESIEKISVRDKHARKILKERNVRFIDLQTIYFIDDQDVRVRSKAIFKIFSYINFPWKIISYFRFFPLALTDYFYKLFAKYRYYF